MACQCSGVMQREILNSFALNVSQVDVAFGVDSDRMDPIDLARLAGSSRRHVKRHSQKDFAGGIQLHQQLIRRRCDDPAVTAAGLPIVPVAVDRADN